MIDRYSAVVLYAGLSVGKKQLPVWKLSLTVGASVADVKCWYMPYRPHSAIYVLLMMFISLFEHLIRKVARMIITYH